MPVLRNASLSQFRPSCGSGSGLRGVLPEAASWSRGTRRCATGEVMTLMQGYTPAGFMGVDGEQPFAKVDGYTEMSSRTDTHVVARSWADLGITAAPAVILADDISDVPVLLVPIPVGQTSGDMAATTTAGLTTPVIGPFAGDIVHTIEFGLGTLLLPGNPIVEETLASVCITRKLPMYIDCPGIGGYWEDGLTTPTDVWCFGGYTYVSSGENLFKRITPNVHHLDYQAAQRVSDGADLGLFTPGAAIASGDYVVSTATLYSNNPPVGTVAGLGDTPCP